jgi:hypothetical protein
MPKGEKYIQSKRTAPPPISKVFKRSFQLASYDENLLDIFKIDIFKGGFFNWYLKYLIFFQLVKPS